MKYKKIKRSIEVEHDFIEISKELNDELMQILNEWISKETSGTITELQDASIAHIHLKTDRGQGHEFRVIIK